MSKSRLFGISVMVVMAMVLAACAPAETVEAPAEIEESVGEVEEPVEEESAAEAEEMEEAMPTVVEVAASNEDFSTLVAAVEAAGLVDTLNGEGPFTVFAPTNAAFDEALAALNVSAEELFADTETLTTILTYHVVAGELMAEDVVSSEELITVEGSPAAISSEMDSYYIENAQIVTTDIEASNGVVHVIDSVIVPASLLENMAAEDDMMEEELPTIVEVAASNEDFSTLVAAVEAAGLVETLNSEGTFTVFAPTDAAFESAFESLGITAEELLADPETLTGILTYHVSDASLLAEDVVAMESIEMLNGQNANISVESEEAYIDDAQIIITDIEASNGVIHVIDAVLLPAS